MTTSLIDDVCRYMDFLEQCGYTVSLSLLDDRFGPYSARLMSYELHPHAYCHFLKQHPATCGQCVQNKKRLKNTELRRAHTVCCWAGVEEYLLPVWHQSTLLAYLHVSGYRGTNRRSGRLAGEIAAKCGPEARACYAQLRTSMPDRDTLTGFLNPLARLLCQLYQESQRQPLPEGATPANALYLQALQLIHQAGPEPVSAKSLAEKLNYSPSYLRQVFRAEAGCPLQAKIQQIRLEKAQRLLRNTPLSVTRIAFATGWTDSNYFSSVFKKSLGLSPLAYRRRYQGR